MLWCPFWREDGSVIYCSCWSSPAQSRRVCPLWREVGSVIYCSCWSSPAQSRRFCPLWREVGSVIYCSCWSSQAQSRWGLPSLTRSRVCLLAVFCQYQSTISYSLHKIFTLSVFDTVQGCIYKASGSPGSVQQIMPQLLVAYTTF
jgi:hypothetical protein